MMNVFRTPLSISSPAIDCDWQRHSYGSNGKKCRKPFRCYCPYPQLGLDLKSKGRCFKILSVSEGCENWFGIAKPRIPRVDMLFRLTSSHTPYSPVHNVSNLDSESTCEEDDVLTQIEEEEDFSSNSIEKKSACQGRFPSQQNLNVQKVVTSEASCVSRRVMTLDGTRLHYLEERDEEVLSNRILKLSRSNKVRSALELYTSMEFSALRPNLHACNSLLSCLLRNDMLDEALKFFEFMKRSGTTTGHTYSLILKAIADSRGFGSAVHLFEELEHTINLKKNFDVVVYNTMIAVCAKVNNWTEIQKVWTSMKDSGHIGSTITYRLLICTFVRCGQNELALDAYYEMVQNGLKPGEDAMQAILGACTKEAKCDLALSIFRSMLDGGMKPNIIACNSLINSLGKAGKVELAFKAYSIMKSLGYPSDAYTWNALLGALQRGNQHVNTLLLFESIQKEQSSILNLHLYNTALMSSHRLGLWDRALQLLWQMESSGLPVSTASYNLVIGACEVARRPEVALQVYEHMVHQKHSPDMFTLLSLLRTCIWGSFWDEVEDILNRNGPNGSLYNAAIQGLCLRGKTDLAKKLYMKMRSNGLKPDGKTRALVLQKFSKQFIDRK